MTEPEYTVHAGGRRLRGFWELREKGAISDDFMVQVREIDPSLAIDMSFIENLSQAPMHPADEFSCFRRLAEQGQRSEQIAKALGCKVLHVKRRLELANGTFFCHIAKPLIHKRFFTKNG